MAGYYVNNVIMFFFSISKAPGALKRKQMLDVTLVKHRRVDDQNKHDERNGFSANNELFECLWWVSWKCHEHATTD